MQLIYFIINPPQSFLADKEQGTQFTLYGALLLEYIWRLRNKVIHEEQVITIEDLQRGLNKVLVEHWAVMKGKP